MERRTASFVICLYNLFAVATSYRCLQCDNVPLPNLCQEVGECGEHELCAVEQFVTTAGTFAYRQSCMDTLTCSPRTGIRRRSDLLTCTECCDGDLCNAAGCGQKGFDVALGPVCYACALQIGTTTCNKVQQCGRDKDCSIHPIRRVGAPDNLFETKCTEKNICAARDEVDSSQLVGRKRSTCSVCCNTTLCNDFDSRPCVPTSTTLSTIKWTTATSRRHSSPTPTTSTSTTPPPPTRPLTTERVTANHFTTSPVSPQDCEDVPGGICYERACTSMTPYLEKNCRKTCKLCGNPAATTPTSTDSPPITSTHPSAATRASSTATTTKNGGHTHDPFCHDAVPGCDTYLNFCITDAYIEWTKTSCRRTCNYC